MTATLIGFISGVISGMGVGGGMILIPSLVLFMALSQREAQYINLVYFLPTAVTALAIHIKNKNVEIKKCVMMVLSGVPASLAGAYCAFIIDADMLRRVFGIFLGIFGVWEIYESFTNKN